MEHSKRSRSRSRNRRSRSRSRSHSRGHENRGAKINSRRLVLINVPYETSWQELKTLFRDKVGDVAFVDLFESNGRPSGLGVVEFTTLDAAQRAVDQMGRFTIRDRNVIIREETPGDRRKIEQLKLERNDRGGGDPRRDGPPMRLGGGLALRGEFEDRFGGGGGGAMGGAMGGGGPIGGGMSGGGGNMFVGREMGGGSGGMGTLGPDSRQFGGDSALGSPTGLSPAASIALSCSKLLSSQQLLALGLSMQFLDVFGIKPDGFASNRVFVANLAYQVTADKLKDAFSLAGRVVEAELRTEDDGRSKGFGTVAYESILEAMHAVGAFNEQDLFGRPMRVRIYVPDDARKQLRDRERDLERLQLDPRHIRLPDGLRSVGPGLATLAGALNKSAPAPAPEPFAPVSDLLASSMLPPRQQQQQQQVPAPNPASFQSAPAYGGGGGQNYSNTLGPGPGSYNSAGGALGSSGYATAQSLQPNNSSGAYNYGQTPTQQPPPPPSQQPYSNYNAGGQIPPSGGGSTSGGFYGGGQSQQSQYTAQQQQQHQQQQQQQQQQSQSSWYSQQPYGGSMGGSAGAGQVAGVGGSKFGGQQSPSAQQPYGQNSGNNYAANTFPSAANEQKYTPPTGYDTYNRGSTGFR